MTFSPADYFPFVSGSGAEKLADSQIAPLVAAVRGYRSFDAIGDAKAAAQHSTPTGKESGGSSFAVKTLKKFLTDDGDIMLMPWYPVGAVLSATDRFPEMQVCQMRPKHPEKDDQGRAQKYLFPGGSKQPVSMHPALTAAWTGQSPKSIITEGIIKEDALLTGMLLHAGISEAELLFPQIAASDAWTWRQQDGLTLLRSLLNRVPAADRLTPLSVAGVNGWTTQKFGQVQMRDQQVIIAFDGDVASNPDVYRAFQKLWEMIVGREGRPRLLDLGSSPALAIIKGSEKFQDAGTFDANGKRIMIGVDDFLSHVGTFPQLLTLVTSDMPAAPTAGTGAQPGELRVAQDGTVVQECRTGQDGSTYWADRVLLGGQVSEVTIRRQPTAGEVRAGRIFDHLDQDAESIARMSVAWERNGRRGECEFDLEAGLLVHSPDRWERKRLTTLPTRLTMLPEWPPNGEDGQKWLRAIKTNSTDYQEHRQWDSSGWVPGKTAPVFVIGSQVLGATREDEDTTRADVDDSIIPSADRFGVDDHYWELVDPNENGEIFAEGLAAYKAGLREDIETVCRLFLDSGVWTDHRHYGSVLLATALRPTIPDRPRSTIYFSGPPQSGKSYLSAMIMGAWQRVPGTWTAQSLPGSASDTKAATERLVSSVGSVWVIDDLAPSASAVQATQTQQMIEDIVRAAFNGSSRSKSNMGGEGGLAKQMPPRAQIVVTAENALTTNSARGRTIQLDLVKGLVDDHGSNQLIDGAINSLALSRVTAAMIRFWHQPHPAFNGEGVALTWPERVSAIDDARNQVKSILKNVLENEHSIQGGDSDRQMTMACDLLLSFRYLQRLYEWAGGTDQKFMACIAVPGDQETYQRMKELVDAGQLPYSVTEDMFALSINALRVGKEQAIGQVLISCISDAVAAGKAHLQNPSIPGEPPFPDTAENLELNRALGWDKRRGEWEGRGEPIGVAGSLASNGDKVALLNPTNSFQLAARLYPSRIPYGQKPEATWRAAAAEGIAELGKGELSVRPRLDTVDARPRGVQVDITHFHHDSE